MIYTEEQAPGIWCDRVRVYSQNSGAANRDGNTEVGPINCCIATRCAHWRWFDPPVPPGTPSFVAPDPTRRGYCGLSGKPEHEE